MSGTITGELRELLADINWTEIIDHMRLDHGGIVDGDWLDSWHAAAGHACDAIDAVHANLERENESLKAELDRVLGEQDDRDGWVRLPVDADGEVIHIGDVVDSPHYEDGTVTGIQYDKTANGNITTMVSVLPHGWDVATWRDPECYRHHQPDTWESIIEDVRRRTSDYYCNNIPCNFREMAEEMVARCRALAGDAS